MSPLSESTIVITCATGEIGSAIARNLAPNHNLILIGRNITKLQAIQGEMHALGKHCYQSMQLDYTDRDRKKSVCQELADRKLTGLVVITPRPEIGLLDEEENWLSTLQSCYTGPASVMKAALTNMREGGKVVVISGITSVQLSPAYGGPSVIRRMWTAFTKALSHELGPKGIRINTVSPGTVLTTHHVERITKKARLNNVSYETQLSQEVTETPLRRYAETSDVAKTVRFLLSDDSSHITGQNICVEGGITKVY
jgi:NAD(P)-dependent dehydrogenase (short-subunit alcohol dehydrogenase family)